MRETSTQGCAQPTVSREGAPHNSMLLGQPCRLFFGDAVMCTRLDQSHTTPIEIVNATCSIIDLSTLVHLSFKAQVRGSYHISRFDACTDHGSALDTHHQLSWLFKPRTTVRFARANEYSWQKIHEWTPGVLLKTDDANSHESLLDDLEGDELSVSPAQLALVPEPMRGLLIRSLNQTTALRMKLGALRTSTAKVRARGPVNESGHGSETAKEQTIATSTMVQALRQRLDAGHSSLYASADACTVTEDCQVGEFCAALQDGGQQCAPCSINDAASCYDLHDCCSAAFLHQCPSNPTQCCDSDDDCSADEKCDNKGHCQASAVHVCTVNEDCQTGEFCAALQGGSHECKPCSSNTKSQCYDNSGGKCCSPAFLEQCPSNPAQCCNSDDDCSADEKCSAGHCVACTQDGDCSEGEYCDQTGSCYDCLSVAVYGCDDISGDCCSPSFLVQCPGNPAQCCENDVDCPIGDFCATGSEFNACFDCTYVSPTSCGDVADNDCCSASFLRQCPNNPAGCCTADVDCPGQVCIAGRCSAGFDQRKKDEEALLAGFMQDPRTIAAWRSLGWSSNASEPCNTPNCGRNDACAWRSLSCTSGRVDMVFLNSPEIGAELGSAIGKLTELTHIYAFEMPLLSGTIPRELNLLPKLLELNIASNPRLSGTLPAELGQLSSLSKIDFGSNARLSGTIPAELGQLSSLMELHLDNDPKLSGTIPSELGQWCGTS